MLNRKLSEHLARSIRTERDLLFFLRKFRNKGLLESSDEEEEIIAEEFEIRPNKTINERLLRQLVKIDENKIKKTIEKTKTELHKSKVKNYDFKSILNEERKINWLWCYIIKNISKEVGYILYKETDTGVVTDIEITKPLKIEGIYLQEKRQSTTEEKRKQIENCLIHSNTLEHEEKLLSNHLKNEWRKNARRTEMIKWLDGCHSNQLMWAYDYIKKRDEIRYTWTPSSNEDMKSVIVAVYDLIPENKKKIFFENFRHAWNVKKSKEKKKKNVVLLENAVLHKVEKLAEQTKKTPEDVIKKLINTMDWDEILDILESE